MAGKRSANTATTKLGTASTITLTMRMEWSPRPFWRTAAIAPSGIASAACTSTVSTTSWMVTGKRRLISSTMGVAFTKELPKSPRKALAIQSK